MIPLRSSHITTDRLHAIMPWRLVRPGRGESCRWECYDGRWVTLCLGEGSEVGSVVVSDSTGRRSLVESYEGAMVLAKSWRSVA